MDIDIVEMNCCVCGCTFWVTQQHRTELISSKKSFSCPNGHSQSYVGESDKKKLANTIEELRHEKIRSEELKKELVDCKKKVRKKKKKR